MKTPTGYIALKRGRHVRNCIFLNWCDAQVHITDYEEAEFSVIDSLEEAEKFIINNDNNNSPKNNIATLKENALHNFPIATGTGSNTTTTITAPSLPPLPPATLDIDIDGTTPASNCSKTHRVIHQSTKEGDASSPSVDKIAASKNNIAIQPVIHRNENDNKKNSTNAASDSVSTTQTPLQTPAVPVKGTTKAAAEGATVSKRTITSALSPSKKISKVWITHFNKLASYRKPDGTYPNPIPDDTVRKWFYTQISNYRRKVCGMKNSMHDEREELFRSIGVVFYNNDQESTTKRPSPTTLPPPPATDIDATTYSNDNNDIDKSRDLSLPKNIHNETEATKANNPEQEAIHRNEKDKVQAVSLSQPEEHNTTSIIGTNAATTSKTATLILPSTTNAVYSPAKRKPQQQQGSSTETRSNKRAKINGSNVAKRRFRFEMWKENLAKLKEYMDANDGNWNVGKKDNPKLRTWMLNQRAQYFRMKEGKDSLIDERKLAMLQEIGVDFDQDINSWPERIEQLKEYKKQNGDLKVPPNHPVLGEWVQNMVRQYERIRAGLPARFLDLSKIDELRKADVDFLDDIQTEWDKEFETMFARLKEYKKKYGSCRIKSVHREYFDVYKWCQKKIQKDFRKLSNKDTADKSRLTTRQIARLTEMGFQFKVEVGGRKSFEERIEQLKDYQHNGGDINNITRKDDSELFDFVGRYRNDYRLWCNGAAKLLNKDRIKILEDIGFDWNIETWNDPDWVNPADRYERKTWDERFQQLLDYKTKHGHVIVPQSTKDGLGQWVKGQRKNYKLMLEGEKKSPMTPEQALRLSNIGFVFDASHYRFKKNRGNTEISNNNNNTLSREKYRNDYGYNESDSE